MFHVCRESHEVPECDDDRSLKRRGQEHDHVSGSSGDGRHGGGIGKGNSVPPMSDEEEDWEIWMSGNYDEGGRQGMSKDSEEGNMEDRRRSGSGSWSGREMLERSSGVVDGLYEDAKKNCVCFEITAST